MAVLRNSKSRASTCFPLACFSPNFVFCCGSYAKGSGRVINEDYLSLLILVVAHLVSRPAIAGDVTKLVTVVTLEGCVFTFRVVMLTSTTVAGVGLGLVVGLLVVIRFRLVVAGIAAPATTVASATTSLTSKGDMHGLLCIHWGAVVWVWVVL